MRIPPNQCAVDDCYEMTRGRLRPPGLPALPICARHWKPTWKAWMSISRRALERNIELARAGAPSPYTPELVSAEFLASGGITGVRP
jgi:hypothetical protein